MSAFNVRWEGSDNLSGDGRNLTLIGAYQMGRPGDARPRWEGRGIRIPDGKALQCAPVRRWEGPGGARRRADGK